MDDRKYFAGSMRRVTVAYYHPPLVEAGGYMERTIGLSLDLFSVFQACPKWVSLNGRSIVIQPAKTLLAATD